MEYKYKVHFLDDKGNTTMTKQYSTMTYISQDLQLPFHYVCMIKRHSEGFIVPKALENKSIVYRLAKKYKIISFNHIVKQILDELIEKDNNNKIV